MTTLHLGVLDQPYASGKGATTTGEVAVYIENKYNVMAHFAQLHEREIVEALQSSVQGSLESILMGAPPAADVHAAGTQKIEQAFRDFLTNREMDALGYPGIPTAAARKGVSHRRKRPYARRAERPSFVDTGLYENSFRAWVD